MTLCDGETCTACTACISVCPKQCITLVMDEDKNQYPLIDRQKCISCDLCGKVCPQLKPIELYEVKKCYAAWRKDTE